MQASPGSGSRRHSQASSPAPQQRFPAFSQEDARPSMELELAPQQQAQLQQESLDLQAGSRTHSVLHQAGCICSLGGCLHLVSVRNKVQGLQAFCLLEQGSLDLQAG